MTDIHKIQPLHLPAFLMFLLPGNVYSASGMLDENALLIDIPTVTTASRFNQHLSDAPVSMTVIDRAMIQASGAQTIPDLFRLVPGFQVAHVNTNKYAVTYHGHSDDFPRRLEVMIDGRSVYFPIISAVDWTSLGLHLEDIERIEVVRGSNTATHGSNAFLGAINIITRHPSTESSFSASGTLGSMNTESGNFRFSGFNSIGHYRISASHESNNGSTLFSDGQQRNYLNYSGSFSPSEQDQIDIWLGVDKGYIHIGELKGREKNTPEELFIPKRKYNSNFQHLQWHHRINSQHTVGIKVSQNHLDLVERAPTFDDFIRARRPTQEAYIFPIQNPNFKIYNEDGKSKQQDIEIYLNKNLTYANSYTGLGFRKSTAESLTLFDQGAVKSTRYRAFNNTTLTLSDSLTFNLGLSYEKEESSENAISGRTAINFHLDNKTTFRAGYTYSERIPSLFESSASTTIYIDREKEKFNAVRRPNSNIKPESINSFELGALYQFENGHLDLRLFNEKIDNGIEKFTTLYTDSKNNQISTNINKNLSTWTNQGAEIQLKIRPHNSIWFLLNYAYINDTKEPYYDGKGSSPVNRINLSPQHSASILANWSPRSDLNLSAAHYYVDQMHWFKGGPTDAYNRTDLRISKSWQPSARTKAETALVIQNAFGPTYQEFYDYHDFERRIFTTFRLRYD